MALEIPLLDYVTPIFRRTEVSAHEPIFCRKQLRGKIGPFFSIGPKVSAFELIFTPIFCLKNRSVFAGHKYTFFRASHIMPQQTIALKSVALCVEYRGRISRSGKTQYIKTPDCGLQFDVPHLWITQRQVGPVSVYYDGVGCPVSATWHSSVVAHWSK